MDVTYNVDRQNLGGYYLKNTPLEPEQPNPWLAPEPPTYYPPSSNHVHHDQQRHDGYDHCRNHQEHGYEHQDEQEYGHRQGHEHSHGLDIPYPPIEVRRPNAAYACILQRVYAGQFSEFTAIAQYFYHHILLKSCYPDAAKTLKEISIQEMHHLEMLAECIVKLGGDPVFGVPKYNYLHWWRGDMVDCSKQMQIMLLRDIQEEYAAIAEYRDIIRCIDDECVIALLERIILDEEEHIRLLSGLLERYWANKKEHT